jgi:hypothetical protein
MTCRAHNFRDLTGQRFGRLVALQPAIKALDALAVRP